MITLHKRCLIAAAIALPIVAIGVPATARAQVLNVDVTVSSLTVAGDTTRITYQVTNHAESTDSIGKFVVEAPAGIKNIVRPTLGGRWMVGRQFVDMSAALWTPLGFRIAPSASTGPLTFEAVGIPGIVRAWVLGGVAPPDTIQDDSPPVPATPIQMLTAAGTPQQVVGIVVIPSTDPSALAARLSGLIGQTCDLGWTDNRGICTSLETKARPDHEQLGALSNELAAQRGKHINELAYQLIQGNIAYLQSKIP